jgi:hypothetical protein
MNLFNAYSRAAGLDDDNQTQTDREEDKKVLDAIVAAGQWHTDCPPFSSLFELGEHEHKGIGIASNKNSLGRVSMIALAITFAPRDQGKIAPPRCLQLQEKAFWLKLVQLVGVPPET